MRKVRDMRRQRAMSFATFSAAPCMSASDAPVMQRQASISSLSSDVLPHNPCFEDSGVNVRLAYPSRLPVFSGNGRPQNNQEDDLTHV